MTPYLHEQIDQFAKSQNVSINHLICEAVSYYIGAHSKTARNYKATAITAEELLRTKENESPDTSPDSWILDRFLYITYQVHRLYSNTLLPILSPICLSSDNIPLGVQYSQLTIICIITQNIIHMKRSMSKI